MNEYNCTFDNGTDVDAFKSNVDCCSNCFHSKAKLFAVIIKICDSIDLFI